MYSYRLRLLIAGCGDAWPSYMARSGGKVPGYLACGEPCSRLPQKTAAGLMTLIHGSNPLGRSGFRSPAVCVSSLPSMPHGEPLITRMETGRGPWPGPWRGA